MALSARSRLLLTTALALPIALLPSAAAFAQSAPAAPAPTASSPAPPSAERQVKPLAADAQPNWNTIRASGGEASPLWGGIRTFSNDVSAFWGGIRTFSGDTQASWGGIRTFNGDVNAYWGGIRTFSGEIDAQWGGIRTFWGGIRTFQDSPGDYAALGGQLNDLFTTSERFWGPAVQAQSGQSFRDAVVNPLLVKYGMDPNTPSSLEHLSSVDRDRFYLEYNDRLMDFTGFDHVDYWMNNIHWSPALTRTIGEGRRSVIGLLDFSVTGDSADRITYHDGVSDVANGHGSAVASLMVAPHDGKGVMGIAPMASVVAYNPFDETQTAGWADIKTGVIELSKRGASIINMSLGVPGWTLNSGWNDVFSDPAVATVTKNKVFVVAAGNDGSVQNTDILWNASTNPDLIVVGSVDPTNKISSFSNQPGTACLFVREKCGRDDKKLMDRFLVAPGELILVSDGHGGTTRLSGTSFAAPLVSGTVALLHDRWPWLANYSKESVDIILNTATDLGAPGTDAVYGRGLLNVQAALSPVSFNNLQFYTYVNGKVSEAQSKKIRSSKEQAKWEAAGMLFYAFEDVGRTFRDFAIPVSSKLVGQTALGSTGAQEQLQGYLTSAFMDWATSSGGGGKQETGGKGDFRSALNFSSPTQVGRDLTLAVALSPRRHLAGYRDDASPVQTAVRFSSPSGAFALTAGDGAGALALGGVASFGRADDYDPFTGGGNPLLGFASGGGFAQVEVPVGRDVTVSAGLSQRELRRDFRQSALDDRATLGALDPNRAGAQHFAVRFRPSNTVSLTGSYTRLRESSALLGVQSLDSSDLANGSTTDGLGLATEVQLTPTVLVAGSATVGRTRSTDAERSNLAVASGGLVSSSFQMGLTKAHLFDRRDRLRLTLLQPMQIEGGALNVTTVQVTDRQTGAIGPVTQRFDVGAPDRLLVGELRYGRQFAEGLGEVALFGRGNLIGGQTDLAPSVVAGAAFKLAF